MPAQACADGRNMDEVVGAGPETAGGRGVVRGGREAADGVEVEVEVDVDASVLLMLSWCS
jgi:hypothetical protein